MTGTGTTDDGQPRANSRLRGLVTNLFVWLGAVAILLLVLRGIDFSGIGKIVLSTRLLWLLPAAVITLISEFIFWTLRYRAILRTTGNSLAFKEVLAIRMGTMPVRQALPFYAGDVVRVMLLSRKHHIRASHSILTHLLNASSQVFGLALAAGIGMVITKNIAGAIVILVLAMICLAAACLSRALDRYAARSRQTTDSLDLISSIAAFSGRLTGEMPSIIMLSIICTACELIASYLIMASFGLKFPGWNIIFTLSAISLIGSIPLTPFGLGIREATVTVLAAGWMGPAGLAISAIASTALLRVLPALAGTYWLIPNLKALAFPKRPRSDTTD